MAKLFNRGGKGFTLIELIISIFILSIAIVGIFTAFSIIVILTSDTVNQLTGTYLAQEGIEIVRNIRDTNWLKMDANVGAATGTYSWDDWLTGCEVAGCEVDYTTTGSGSTVVLHQTGDYLRINPITTGGNGFYNYTTGTDTKFQRKIIITPIEDVDGKDDHIMKVKVEVSWDKKATILFNSYIPASTCNPSNCITTEETLYNWYNYLGQ
ncbi:MAG: prepilin-type N-terminal cleavage/methylation domain-containing protein [Candidatus Staskawiczbacteria bacterium]|nr:prepilin-type N-terminal cleavage/methylation domain-containing protein [Candidatus Staskawiczbacteria bacterium]